MAAGTFTQRSNVKRGTKTYKPSIHDAVRTAGKKCETTAFLVYDG